MMIHKDLREIPRHPLPAGFFLRTYQPGDEEHWFAIHQKTEKLRPITSESFAQTFGRDVTLLSQRQFYLTTLDGDAAGTGTAWFDHQFHGQKFGRVHWVAIKPQYQGHGLSKSLLSAILQKLQDLGHQQVYLRTSTQRIAAINLYLKFGFTPLIEKPEDDILWEKMRPNLKYQW